MPVDAAAVGQGDPELGARIYRDGKTADGEAVQARVQGDIVLRGSQVGCANCHRRSGYGSSEGGVYVPPITGPALFEPRRPDRADLFKKLFKERQPRRFQARIRSPRMRPAYDVASLARAIEEGVDPAGRTLDPAMPRYQLGKADMTHLTAHLRDLSATSDPGVDSTQIHFATIVSADGDPAERDAMLATMEAFFAWINRDIRGDLRNPNFSPNYRTEFVDSYRLWQLHVWELSGPPATWRRQLTTWYGQQPVFAVISGLVPGPWRPVHDFCEAERLPCLFPHTALPVAEEGAVYSIHFHRGLALEAEVLARHLLAYDEVPRPIDVVQLHDATWRGRAPATILAEALAGAEGIRLETRALPDGVALKAALADVGSGDRPPDALVIWPGRHAPRMLGWLADDPPAVARLYLPSAAMEEVPPSLPADLTGRLRFVHPYELPDVHHPRAFRVRAWMNSRSLDISHERLQFDTYYALTLAQFGLEHIVGKFSRDYLLEYVEHEAENALNPGTYPRLALGPGQRFASKGAYVVRLDAEAGIVAESDWIVP